MSGLAEQIAAAVRDHTPLPVMPPDLSLTSAYALQAKVVRLVSPPAGIKAGVTNPALQKNFGIDHALLGRLFEHRRLEPGAELPAIDGQLLECELGIIVDADGQPTGACLTIEFAFLKFARPGDASAPNLVAANVATDAFMAAKPIDWCDIKGGVQLYCGEELVNDAPITESLGGPASALEWIRAEAARFDIPLKAGDLIMTGACGKVLPAVAGHYRAVCDGLGELEFTIT